MDTIKANKILNENNINKDAKFKYMLLSRMQEDCEYYLNHGKAARQLWAQDEQKQIEIMRALWLTVPKSPEWLTMGQINDLSIKMNVPCFAD